MHLETVTEIVVVIPPFKDLFNTTYADVDIHAACLSLCKYMDYVSCFDV